MTRDDIIKLAHEAGLIRAEDSYLTGGMERFAALVSAAEREECAKIAETPVGEYEVVVACGIEPTPRRIPRYLDWQSIANAIRARSIE